MGQVAMRDTNEPADEEPWERSVDELFLEVLEELQRQAQWRISQERAGHTLQPTALVHEVYVRLSRGPRLRWKSRVEFLRYAGRIMKNALIDYARARNTIKRTKNPLLGSVTEYFEEQGFEILALGEAIEGLEEKSEEAARLVEMHFFAGATTTDLAESLGVSVRTVERKLQFALTQMRRILEL